MAVVNINLTCELQKAVKVEYIDGVLFSQDNQANQINVTVLDGGEPATISGDVSANIVCSDGGTVAATGGSITGNVASITLPGAAYAVPGVVSIVVKLTTSGVITTIAAIVGNMYRSSTDTAIDPGTIIPSIQTLISQINTAVASIPADYSSLWTKLAPAFSTSASYVAGQYVTYNSGLYRFNTTHTGNWSSSDVTAVNLGGEISDLKSAIDNSTDTEIVYFIDKNYINTNVEVGATVNLSSLTSSQTMSYAVVPCQKGDIFTITGQGGSNGRIYAILDSDDKLLEKSGSSISWTNAELIIDKDDAAKIVFNARFDRARYVCKNKTLFNRVESVKNTAINIDGEIFGTGETNLQLIPGCISGDLTWKHYENTSHIILPVKSGDSIYIRANNSNKTFFAFLTDDTVGYDTIANLVSGTERYTVNAGSSAIETAPAGSVYLYLTAYYQNANYYPQVLRINGIDRLKSISQKISNINDHIDLLNPIINTGMRLNYSIIKNKQLLRDGSITDATYSTYYVTSNIPVVAGKTYYIDLTAQNIINHSDYAFFDENGNLLKRDSYFDRGDMTANTKTSYIVKAPADSEYLIVSGYNYQDEQFPIIRETIGITDYVSMAVNSTVYVSPTGNDANDGLTKDTAFATIQKAIDINAKNIILAPGSYRNQNVRIDEKNGINIICQTTLTEKDYITKFNRKRRAVLDNSIEIEGIEDYSGILRASLSLDENSNYYKVFISQELPVDYSSESYYGDIPTYNAILWEQTEDISKCKQMIPVLSLETCISTSGSFHYDGSYLYINPTDATAQNTIYKRLQKEDTDTEPGIYIRKSTNIHIVGLDVVFFPMQAIYLNLADNTLFENCNAMFTNYKTAISNHYSNAKYVNCVSAYSGGDGWGVSYCGNISLIDCSGIYCADDGVSHHAGCTGIIDGGKYEHNMKGGVTPAFGALIDVRNVTCRYNAWGIYYTSTSASQVAGAECTIRNCLSYDNNNYDITIAGYHVIAQNCAYRTKELKYSGQIDEYGNTILNS